MSEVGHKWTQEVRTREANVDRRNAVAAFSASLRFLWVVLSIIRDNSTERGWIQPVTSWYRRARTASESRQNVLSVSVMNHYYYYFFYAKNKYSAGIWTLSACVYSPLNIVCQCLICTLVLLFNTSVCRLPLHQGRNHGVNMGGTKPAVRSESRPAEHKNKN